VIASQAGEILQDFILTHSARQIFENIGGVIRVPTMQGLPLRIPGVTWIYCFQFMCPADQWGHETEIEIAFVPDEDKTDLSKWLYNGTIDKVGDLGYWVGYRIVKSYYQHAADKRQAIRGILEMSDPKAFLARSGWRPGIVLQ
jgi:hypothetical protein